MLLNFQKIIKDYAKENINSIFNNLLKYSKSKKIVVINFHRINDIGNNLLGTKISKNFFEIYINYLNNNFNIIKPLDFLKNNIYFNKREKIKILITFDDGYYDNYKIAFPILKKLNILPIFFICPYYISSNKKIWDEDLVDRILNILKTGKEIKFKDIIFNKYSSNLSKDLFKIINYLKFYNQFNRDQIIDNIFPLSCKNEDVFDRCMNWDEIRYLSNNNAYIGSHTYSHTSMGKTNENDLNLEIVKSKSEIEKKINKSCEMFAFPYGSTNDYNIDVIEALKNNGFKKSFLNFGYFNNFKKSDFCLKRVSITNNFKNNMIFKLL